MQSASAPLNFSVKLDFNLVKGMPKVFDFPIETDDTLMNPPVFSVSVPCEVWNRFHSVPVTFSLEKGYNWAQAVRINNIESLTFLKLVGAKKF